jgi:sec-independent protein translocase protein TatA
MFGTIGWPELVLLVLILSLVFGASRVGALGGALGKGIREFRSEASKTDDKDKDKAPATAAADKPADGDKSG